MPKGVYKRQPYCRALPATAKNLGRGRQKGALVIGAYAIDPETHTQIRERAIKYNTSFSEQLRLLIEWGLETDGNS